MTPIKTIYKDTEITYDENRNVWTFTLLGRDRKAESLANAKVSIDKLAAQEKAKAFDPVPAILVEYGGKHTFGKITSIAESGDDGTYVWFSADGNRRKHRISDLTADLPANRQLLAEAAALGREIDTLRKKRDHKLEELSPVTITVTE